MVPWLFAYIFTFFPSMTADTQWRLILGLGSIPIAICLAGSILEEQWNKQPGGHDKVGEVVGVDTDTDMEGWVGVGVGVGGGATTASLRGMNGEILTGRPTNSNTPSTSSSVDKKDPVDNSPDRKSTRDGSSSTTSSSSTPIATTINITSPSPADRHASADAQHGHSHSHNHHNNSTASIGVGPRISFAPEMGGGASNSLCDQLGRNRNMYKLLATGGGWLLYDVVYYGVSLFGGEILETLENGDNDDVKLSNASIRKTTSLQLIALAMGLPAVIFSIYLIKMIGTKRLQMLGFVFIAVSFVIMAVLFQPLKNDTNALFSVYCILLFALSFGPNVTTFILPAEVYPKYQRATFNGISAACGKLGAVIGAYVFGPIADLVGYEAIMFSCAVLAILGALISHYFIFDEESFDLGSSIHGSRRSSVNSQRLSVGSLGRLSVGDRGEGSGIAAGLGLGLGLGLGGGRDARAGRGYGILINDEEEKDGGEII